MADKTKPDPETEQVDEEYTDTGPLDKETLDAEPVTKPDAVAGSDLPQDNLPEEAKPEIVETPESEVEPEVVEATTAEPEVVPEVMTQRIVEKRSVFVPAVLGGIVAAGLGFMAAKTDFVEGYFPNSKANQAVAGFEQALRDQSEQVAALKDQVSGLQIPDLSGVESQMAAISAQLAPLSTSIEGLETRLATLDTSLATLANRVTAVEKRPISEGVSQSAIDAYENELSRLQETMVIQRAEVEAMIEAAKAVETSAKQTQADAAGVLLIATNKTLLADLRATLESGSPYTSVLGELSANGLTIPDDLAASAATGIATLAALQESFPDVARATLALSREAKTDTDKGLGAFIRRQLGARSVTPRDGDDADAVLSRAEAALTDGQIATALDELSALPQDVAATMADWTDSARIRLAAITASDALGRELNTK